QYTFLCRHDVLAPVQDGLHNGGFRAAMEPYVVRKVGSTHSRVALAVGTVAGHAERIEVALAGNHAQRVVCQAGQRTHVLSNVGSLAGFDLGTPGRHHAMTAFPDGVHDLLGLTTPQPVVIGQVGEAGSTTGIRAVTLCAVVKEQALADFTSCRVTCHFFKRLFTEAGVERCNPLLQFTLLCQDFSSRAVAAQAGPETQ